MTKINPKFKGVIKRGAFVPDNIKYFSYLQSLESREVVCTIVEFKIKKQRSINQNAYYWGVVIPLISEVTGYDKNEMHEVLKLQLLSHIVVIKKQEYKVTKSTASLSTTEMEDYLNRCRMWSSSEFGIYIPEPNETDYQQ